MAPSAIPETPAELYKDEQTSTSDLKEKEKTPLEAISHGDLVMPGIYILALFTLFPRHVRVKWLIGC
jgi:hypothetical protein